MTVDERSDAPAPDDPPVSLRLWVLFPLLALVAGVLMHQGLLPNPWLESLTPVAPGSRPLPPRTTPGIRVEGTVRDSAGYRAGRVLVAVAPYEELGAEPFLTLRCAPDGIFRGRVPWPARRDAWMVVAVDLLDGPDRDEQLGVLLDDLRQGRLSAERPMDWAWIDPAKLERQGAPTGSGWIHAELHLGRRPGDGLRVRGRLTGLVPGTAVHNEVAWSPEDGSLPGGAEGPRVLAAPDGGFDLGWVPVLPGSLRVTPRTSSRRPLNLPANQKVSLHWRRHLRRIRPQDRARRPAPTFGDDGFLAQLPIDPETHDGTALELPLEPHGVVRLRARVHDPLPEDEPLLVHLDDGTWERLVPVGTSLFESLPLPPGVFLARAAVGDGLVAPPVAITIEEGRQAPDVVLHLQPTEPRLLKVIDPRKDIRRFGVLWLGPALAPGEAIDPSSCLWLHDVEHGEVTLTLPDGEYAAVFSSAVSREDARPVRLVMAPPYASILVPDAP